MNKEMLIEQVGASFVNGMPFNQFLNISVESLTPEQAKISFPWQDVFIGNPAQKIKRSFVFSEESGSESFYSMSKLLHGAEF